MCERIKGKTLIATDEGDVVNGVVIKLYGTSESGCAKGRSGSTN